VINCDLVQDPKLSVLPDSVCQGNSVMYCMVNVNKSSATAEDGRPYESSTTLFTSAVRRIFSNR